MLLGKHGASSAALPVVIAILVVAVATMGALLVTGKSQPKPAATKTAPSNQPANRADLGCGENSGLPELGPAEVTAKLVEAIRSGDMVGAEDYLTDHGKTVPIQHGMRTYEGAHREIQGVLEVDGAGGQKVFFDYEKTRISGKTARVPFGIEDSKGGRMTWSIVLANYDGEWKVDNVEF